MNRRTIIVSGALANKRGQGGEAWVRLSWVVGFQKLGFEVFFLEQMDEAPDPAAIAYFRNVIKRFRLSGALINKNGKVLAGVPVSWLEEVAQRAGALINISGHLTFAPVMERVEPRVYIDIDPGFTQFWHASGNPGARLEHHDFYFTIGENIGTSCCEIPTCGIAWRHTRPPVVLEHWPYIGSARKDIRLSSGLPFATAHDRVQFTTVANWRGAYGPVQFQGKSYGLKVHEFRKLIQLPRRSRGQFEIALQIHPGDNKDLDALLENDWHIVDPNQVAASPESFRQYVHRSGAEFSVAQGVYVDTNCGWFSDRTVRYLASGKPALVQDTGFSRHIPVGEGLLAFRTVDEAIEGVERIYDQYEQHCRAARRLAEEYFDSNEVIGKLLDEIGYSPPQPRNAFMARQTPVSC